jgi:hypothetical protein
MTSPPHSPGTQLSEMEGSRASLEEAMAKHDARQRRRRPLLWVGIPVVVGATVIGITFGVSLYSKSLSGVPERTGDPGGRILHGLVKSVFQHLPLDAQVLSHTYKEPRWHNCSPRHQAAYSDDEALVVFRSAIPAVVATSATALASQKPPLVWSDSFKLPSGESVDEQVSVQWTPVSGSDVRTWTFDARAPAIGFAREFCGGPS